jgi:predicted lysophospholipase L1 biosynthesis ABC-type transport system permease subunit
LNQSERVAAGYRGNPLGFPTFILGGAFLSTIIGSLQGVVVSAVDSLIGQIILIVALFAVMVAASWIVLRGAAIARRRIKLTTDQPLDALYQTIGRCGRPPQDQARVFALLALILMAIAWIAVPIALGASFLVR